MLNIPPDRRGLLHENDVAALRGWRKLLDETFSQNLAARAKVKANSYRGESSEFAPSQVTDDDFETYWATDNAITTGNIEIDLGKEQTIQYVVLQEYIPLG